VLKQLQSSSLYVYKLILWHNDTFSFFFYIYIPKIFIYNRILFTQDWVMLLIEECSKHEIIADKPSWLLGQRVLIGKIKAIYIYNMLWMDSFEYTWRMCEIEPNHFVRFVNIFIYRSCFATNYMNFVWNLHDEVDTLVETCLIYEDRLLKMITE
jgi:hypothetical protein